MNPQEQAIADAMYAGVQHFTNFSNRSLQAKQFKVGISDLGFCSERTKRMLKQEVPEDRDALPAFIGTALGDHIEQATEAVWPDAIRQATVSVQLAGESGQLYTISGHPDLILPSDGIILDVKTTRGLETVRRTGPSQQQQFQRHLYAKAAWLHGHFGDLPLEDVQVGNVWMDRAGDERELHVQLEPFDEKWVIDAGQWLDEVVYAYLQGEEARKEPPREMCAKVCGFYDTCRALDTDVEGLLTDETVLAAVAMDREGAALIKEGYKLRDTAKPHLEGVEGSTGEYLVRWTVVNDSEVKFRRKAYNKLTITKLPKFNRIEGTT